MNILNNIIDTTNYKLEKGIYSIPNEEVEKISYPADSNNSCYSIEEKSFWFKHRNRIIVELVKKFAPDNIFLDVGGGNGIVSNAILDAGIPAILVEPGVQGCINAKKRNIESVFCMTFDKISFLPSKKAVSIGLFDVIEHIENDENFLQSIYDKIPKGSKLFFTVPAYQELWSDEDILAGHYRRYTHESLRKVAEKVGFKTLFSTYIFSFLPIPIYIFRVIPFLLRSKFKSINEKIDSDSANTHTVNNSIGEKILNKISIFERMLVRRLITFPFGGSVLLVVEK